MLTALAMVMLLAGPGGAEPTPRGDPTLWITQSDYPQRAKAAREHGDTAFRLDIGIDGRATACTVTSSSGSKLLDDTTCTLLRRRAWFKPALDAEGNKVAGQWSSIFHWVLD